MKSLSDRAWIDARSHPGGAAEAIGGEADVAVEDPADIAPVPDVQIGAVLTFDAEREIRAHRPAPRPPAAAASAVVVAVGVKRKDARARLGNHAHGSVGMR